MTFQQRHEGGEASPVDSWRSNVLSRGIASARATVGAEEGPREKCTDENKEAD